MSELINRAKSFATSAHQRIGHLRKYSDQPYQVHLESVARMVATVTDDPEMIAAAGLHDVVEDTPATLGDVEREFGAAVAALVQDLTDVSRPSDGNRAIRKERDRQHTAHASAPAKTIKLADLIDNCLQLANKAMLTLEYQPARDALALPSKRAGKELVKDLESLRNHLAHSQDIVSTTGRRSFASRSGWLS